VYVVNASDLKAVTPSPGNQLCKFADDTELIPASNVDSRATEIDNIETWARTNSDRLFRRRQIESPPPAKDIARFTSLKILCVTMTNGLSASDHVRDVIRSCAQTLYALGVLRAHGMCHAALQAIFRSVAIAKLLYIYGSSAWIGLTKATDRQRVDGFIRRSIRSGYCSPDIPTFAEQCVFGKCRNKRLFNNICHNQNHVLHSLLPPPSTASQTRIFHSELTANNYHNILDI